MDESDTISLRLQIYSHHVGDTWWKFEVFVTLTIFLEVLKDLSSLFFSLIDKHFILVTLLGFEFDNHFSLGFWCLCFNNIVIVAPI